VVPDYEVEDLNRIGNTDRDDSDIDLFKEGVKAMSKKKTPVCNPWTKDAIRQLKTKTPVVEVAGAMKTNAKSKIAFDP
jgi:hypothetical protein